MEGEEFCAPQSGKSQLEFVKRLNRDSLGSGQFEQCLQRLQDINISTFSFKLKPYLLQLLWKVCLLIKSTKESTLLVGYLKKTNDLAKDGSRQDLVQSTLMALIEVNIQLKNWEEARSCAEDYKLIYDANAGRKFLVEISVKSGNLAMTHLEDLLNNNPSQTEAVKFVVAVILEQCDMKQQEICLNLVIQALEVIRNCDDLAELYCLLMMTCLGRGLKKLFVDALSGYLRWIKKLGDDRKSNIRPWHNRIVEFTEYEMKKILKFATKPESLDYVCQLAVIFVLLNDNQTCDKFPLWKVIGYQIYCIRICQDPEKAQCHLSNFIRRGKISQRDGQMLQKMLDDDNFDRIICKPGGLCHALSGLKTEDLSEMTDENVDNVITKIELSTSAQSQVRRNSLKLLMRLIVRKWIALSESENRASFLTKLIQVSKLLHESSGSESPNIISWLVNLLWNLGIQQKENGAMLLQLAGDFQPFGEARISCRLAQVSASIQAKSRQGLTVQVIKDLSDALESASNKESEVPVSIFRMKALIMLGRNPDDAVLEAIKTGDFDTMQMLICLLSQDVKHKSFRTQLLRMSIVTATKATEAKSVGSCYKKFGLANLLLLIKDCIENVDHLGISNLIPDIITLAQGPTEDGKYEQAILYLIYLEIFQAASKLSFTDAFNHSSRILRNMLPSLVAFIPRLQKNPTCPK